MWRTIAARAIASDNQRRAAQLRRAPTLAMKSAIDRKVIEAGICAGSEYGSEFRSDLESIFGLDQVNRCVEIGIFERPPDRNVKHVAFVDVAGGGGQEGHGEQETPFERATEKARSRWAARY